jgi:hypothetical protein
MKISHELPLVFLDKAREWNDYDYCLPHLLDKFPAYREYFLEARKDDRFIIMDNGLFEGVKHTQEDLIDKINLIQPDIFVVPDEWNDCFTTYENARRWMIDIKPHLPEKTNLMVVIQGGSESDFRFVYQGSKDHGYKYFAFNHSSIAYQRFGSHKNKLVNQMFGRIHFVTSFFRQNIIESSDYIHLLGCSLPQEFNYYGDYKINSMDTSNPIIFGHYHQIYAGDVFNKPALKIEQLMDYDFGILEKKYIESNIKAFRKFINEQQPIVG